MISAAAPSCSPRCLSSGLLSFKSRALSPTVILSISLESRIHPYPRIFAVKQQQSEASKSAKKKQGKRRAPGRLHPGEDGIAIEVISPVVRDEKDRLGNRFSPLPKPPAGFVLDDHGRVLLASNKRVTTIVDATNNLPLECVIRRVFQSSQGNECMLLCPVDTPVQILKSTSFTGWSAVHDDEVKDIIPSIAYALAKIHMYLVVSGFCYTARGSFCYTEDDIMEFFTELEALSWAEECITSSIVYLTYLYVEMAKHKDGIEFWTADDGEENGSLPTEVLEITCFSLDEAQYMIYTPSDPLLFVAVKDNNGKLRIADNDVLEDPATVNAIDEETEFNALVEEEAALLKSLLGER